MSICTSIRRDIMMVEGFMDRNHSMDQAKRYDTAEDYAYAMNSVRADHRDPPHIQDRSNREDAKHMADWNHWKQSGLLEADEPDAEPMAAPEAEEPDVDEAEPTATFETDQRDMMRRYIDIISEVKPAVTKTSPFEFLLEIGTLPDGPAGSSAASSDMGDSFKFQGDNPSSGENLTVPGAAPEPQGRYQTPIYPQDQDPGPDSGEDLDDLFK